MFVLSTNPTFTHTVKVMVPVDGGHHEQTFRATFRCMAAEEVAAYDLHDGASSAKFLRAVLVGLDDIVGADDQALPYNDLLRDRLLSLPYVRAGLARTYFDAMAKATLGN